MKHLILIAALSAASLSTFANTVDIDMHILSEKAGLCLQSNKWNNPYCEDFTKMSNYIFKGGVSTYLTYHDSEINGTNVKFVSATMDKVLAAMKLINARKE